MTDRIVFLYPEIALFIATCAVMVIGLSRNFRVRKAAAVVTAIGLLAAAALGAATTPRASGPATCPVSGTVFAGPLTADAGQVLLPELAPFAKTFIPLVALLLLLPMAGTVDRDDEAAIAAGRRTFDPLRSNRAEFYAFFLFSITGLLLCASAADLIWLFLALELTSLPTYIMVAISTRRNRSREAAVKYFFLGALGAAVFLFGFVLIFGGTGQTNLNQISLAIASHGINTITLAGLLLSILGLAFKIAAVPMHLYTPDVYQGAAPQVSGFLAFVPKTAGFLAILLLAATVGWRFGADSVGVGPLLAPGSPAAVLPSPAGSQLPHLVWLLLWVMAALTMTVGNVLAVLQSNVKRILAYSSIAHSGYMLVGIVAGPGLTPDKLSTNGITAVLFYLVAYGVTNAGAFAVLAALERSTPDAGIQEVETVDDLRGLCRTHPWLGWSMVVCALSLLGLPPLLGFFSKLPLFTSGISSGQITLVVILGVNSAIAAFYYLRLAFSPLLEPHDEAAGVRDAGLRSRHAGAVISAALVVLLSVLGGVVLRHAHHAAAIGTPKPQSTSK